MVQTRLSASDPWSDHVEGSQDLVEGFEIDTYVRALEVRLLGRVSAPVTMRYLAVFGDGPTE